MPDPIGHEAAFHLLCLQAEWGADEAVEPEPLDRLRPRLPDADTAAPAMTLPDSGTLAGSGPKSAAVGERPIPAGSAAVTPRIPSAVVPRGTPAERAMTAAAAAMTLEQLRTAIAGFDGCALRDTASHLVFAEGDPAATLVLVGEPPGREEDRGGHPFAGAEGQLLDQMLASIGLNRANLMLTHLLPWRPPGGRPPNPTELAICLPFLHRLLSLQRPRRLLLLGGSPARALLPPGTVRRRGPRDWVDASIPGLPAPVPALSMPGLPELIRTPPQKREAWTALRLLRRTLDAEPTGM